MQEKSATNELTDGTPSRKVQPSSSRLLDLDEVAERCSVSTKTVRRWIEGDGLPVHRLPGNGLRPIIRVAEDDLENWRHRFRRDVAKEHEKEPVLRFKGMRFLRND
jgi:excisionase family DNA binding protein